MTTQESRLNALVCQWRSEATRLRTRYADESKAHLLEALAVELEETLRVEEERLCSLTEAAVLTGYAADTLSKMVRSGKLANHGRKNAPKVRVSECPKKAATGVLPMTSTPLHLVYGSKEHIARAVVASL
jgi:hypothetical protein